jgi:hypothetical protein
MTDQDEAYLRLMAMTLDMPLETLRAIYVKIYGPL